MRILADENVPSPVVSALRSQGHDVAWVLEDARGAKDDVVLARAQSEGRVLVTFDKDFGELAFRSGLPATCGVVLFRNMPAQPLDAIELVLAAFARGAELIGHFSVVEDRGIRIRPLPGAQDEA